MQFRVQFGINLQDWIFQKAGIARAASANKTLKGKLIPNWTRKKKTVWLLIKKFAWRKYQEIFFPEAMFRIRKNLFQSLGTKLLSSFYLI